MTELSKYQQTAKRILELEDNFKLNMTMFCSLNNSLNEEHECGTTYCLAGILAHQDGYPKEYISCISGYFFYWSYSEDLIGFGIEENEWRFLFSEFWSNSLEHAKKRAQYVLENDACPNEEEFVRDWSSEYNGLF